MMSPITQSCSISAGVTVLQVLPCLLPPSSLSQQNYCLLTDSIDLAVAGEESTMNDNDSAATMRLKRIRNLENMHD